MDGRFIKRAGGGVILMVIITLIVILIVFKVKPVKDFLKL